MAEFAAIVPIVTCDYESSIRGLLDIADEYAILGRKGFGESCARGRRHVSGTGDRNRSESAEHQQESCRRYKAGCDNFLRHSTIRQSISIDAYLILSVRRSLESATLFLSHDENTATVFPLASASSIFRIQVFIRIGFFEGDALFCLFVYLTHLSTRGLGDLITRVIVCQKMVGLRRGDPRIGCLLHARLVTVALGRGSRRRRCVSL